MADAFINAEDLLAKMRAGTAETYEIKLRQLTIPVRVLTLDERVDMRQRMMVANAKMQGDEIFLASLLQKETLKLASTMSDGSTLLTERLLAMLTLDEVTYLYLEYERICEQINPSLEVMKPEQFQALVEDLKKNRLELNELNLPRLRAIALAYQDLIQRLDLERLQRDNVVGGQS